LREEVEDEKFIKDNIRAISGKESYLNKKNPDKIWQHIIIQDRIRFKYI